MGNSTSNYFSQIKTFCKELFSKLKHVTIFKNNKLDVVLDEIEANFRKNLNYSDDNISAYKQDLKLQTLELIAKKGFINEKIKEALSIIVGTSSHQFDVKGAKFFLSVLSFCGNKTLKEIDDNLSKILIIDLFWQYKTEESYTTFSTQTQISDIEETKMIILQSCFDYNETSLITEHREDHPN